MTLRQPTERHGGNARFDEEVTNMVSKATASLDAWLTQAEEVLQEQREQSLSPSSTGPWNDANYDSIVTLATFEQGLAELLDQLCNRPGRWVLIANDARRANWFWQALAFEDGSLIVEVVSNRYLESTELQSPADEEKLEHLEWEAPDPVTSPNWRRVEATTSPATAEVARQAVQTLREVFRMVDEDRLLLKTFAVADRGDTPASECVPVPESVPESTGVQPSFRPTTEIWADYYRQLYPGHIHPRNSFDSWKYATTAVGVAEQLWEARERARLRWESENGDSPPDWPVAHPPVVLWLPMVANAACLVCSWIARGSDATVESAGHIARDHSVEHGSDRDTVRQHRVPISERDGPIDEALEQTWV
jgi:hypothetical protein